MGNEYPEAGVRVVLETMLKECLASEHIPLLLITQSTVDRGGSLRVQRIAPLEARACQRILEHALQWAKEQEW